MYKLVAAIFSALLSCVSVSEAREIVNEQFGFTITIPDGYVDYPLNKDVPNMIYCYAGELPTGELIIISISRMFRSVDPEGLSILDIDLAQETLGYGSFASVYQTKWKGLLVEGLQCKYVNLGSEFWTKTVLIPLKSETIVVGVEGPQSAQFDLFYLLEQLVSSVEGDPDPDYVIKEKFNEGKRVFSSASGQYWMGAFVVTIIIIGMLFLRRKQKAEE